MLYETIPPNRRRTRRVQALRDTMPRETALRGRHARMKLVIHVCCAPCLAGTLDVFAQLGDVLAYFCNPNIHPLLEFRRRLRAFEVFGEREKVRFDADREYGLRDFLRQVGPDGAGRCLICYRERLRRTARYAAAIKAEGFSTTLVSSTHQDHEAIRLAGEDAANEFAVVFLYRDLRHLAGVGEAIAKKMGIYRQQYCGCIFSEYERYKDTNTEVHRRMGRA